MSPPEPRAVNVPFANDALPAIGTAPTSASPHGLGRLFGALAVVNDQTGPPVDPLAFLAVTRQK